MSSQQCLSLAIVLIIAVVLIRLLRQRKIKEKYIWLWLFIDLIALAGALAPGWVSSIASALGFALASNLIFFAVCVLLVVLTIHLAVVVTSLEEDRRRLTEEIAILRHDLDALEKEIRNKNT